MIDLTFAIDLVLNFRTARIQKTGMLDITAKGMACAYLRGWFAVDFMSTFPFVSLKQQQHLSPASSTSLLLHPASPTTAATLTLLPGTHSEALAP